MSSERLFERGVSLSAESGRGLGLAVVRELVEAAGGRAQALERPEGGALFRLAFPKV
jgi:sensor histidine kinase regulating citrate/malate metabolism